MNFDDLVLYVEATHNMGKPPGIAILVGFDFKGPIEDFFYCRVYSQNKKASIPQASADRLKGYIANQDKFYAATDVERPPTPEEKKRLSDAIIELQRRNPALGKIISLMNVVYAGGVAKQPGHGAQKVKAKELRTFAVDDYNNLFINLGYANLCSEEQLIGVLAHEAMHISLSHHKRLKERSPFQIANIATDALINNELISGGYEVGYGMGVFAKDNKINLRIMYIQADVPDINIAKPQDFEISVDIANRTWEQLFDIIIKLLKDPSQWKRNTFAIGDIVYDKTSKTYGVVVKTDKSWYSTNAVDVEIKPITEEKAKELAKQKAGI